MLSAASEREALLSITLVWYKNNNYYCPLSPSLSAAFCALAQEAMLTA